MSENATQMLHTYVSAKGLAKIDDWIAKYPADQKQSAVMGALTVIQEENSYLTDEAMTALAAYLDMAPIAVFEVASFYSMYERAPVGRHVIGVCTNISCKLRDSAKIMSHLEKKLKINCGETTADERFTLRSVECLGACVNAPMMQIDKEYHEHLTQTGVDKILKKYK
ncbi:MAG: NADH-quinone oxidoreductase subunit NuoE [Gammaproteobacteria bacterium]|nr:NADH-quinone oxidoreductase subunit NuoE [Gammaproteobacteria bacterium]